MNIAHLTSSPFFGGPERQMLGLARALPDAYRSVFLAFAEGEKHRALLGQVGQHGFEGVVLRHNYPRVGAVVNEIANTLQRLGTDILCCHGYKADLLGWWAARRAGVHVISVSHGWTGATIKVRVYEALDRIVLRWMDCVVAVSEAQAVKVRRWGVPAERVVVVHNAIRPEISEEPTTRHRGLLKGLFAEPFSRIVGAIGRLSPEKGFEHLVKAALIVTRRDPSVGFVLFGDGPLRETLTRQIVASGLQGKFVLAGFRNDVERFLPLMDVLALPSYTEGLPVVVLEAFAAGVPVVATRVGGTPEVVEDGVNGYLVEPEDASALARRIREVLRSEPDRLAMGQRGRQHVLENFTFEAQSVKYQEIFARIVSGRVVSGEWSTDITHHSPPSPQPLSPAAGERGRGEGALTTHHSSLTTHQTGSTT